MTSTTDILSGNWKQLSGEIKKQWGKLTDEELKKADGVKDKVLGLIQEKYGLTKLKAQAELEEFLEAHENDFQDLKEKATRVIQDFSESVSENTQQVKEQFQEYSGRLEECIQSSPIKSVLIATGIGLLLGALFLK